MSFVKRAITVNFQLSNDDFGNGNNSLTVSGLRVEAMISEAGGTAGSTLYAKIYGMRESDMLKCCTYAQFYNDLKKIVVTVIAGDSVAGMSQVFQGTIHDCRIDYDNAPDVALVIQCRAGYYEQVSSAAPNSHAGSCDVATMIQSLAKSIGFQFKNSGVNQSLQNHYTYGSVIEQIQDIARAAQIDLSISNGKITIWPVGAGNDSEEIVISPANGLRGYPTFISYGYQITSEFNADIVHGRKCQLTTSIQRANGKFYILSVQHMISSEMPEGPWFSMAILGVNNSVVAING
jgi:hypothetical protein